MSIASTHWLCVSGLFYVGRFIMYVVDESCDKSVTSAYLMGLVNRHNSLGENDDKVESLA